MKIHSIRIEPSLLEIDGHEEWFFRVRAEIKPRGQPKLMQTTHRFDARLSREEFPKTMQLIGMELSRLSIMDEGAI